ncbi:uncharacterized protein LOC119583866 [Penaeus monodon]|uniref:uncharacterized protein LOC119583866 n=1 Tax=Penaeus monodon TaxID=6687 RepID=UPI0018A6D990|nr:uncharacterized protein LOC119583866 [Penaeus monodon]
MPKLYWRSRNDEVVSAKPSRVGMVSPPRPGTQDSAQTPAHLLWLQTDDGSADGGKFRNGHGGGGSSDSGEGRSPDLMKLNNFAPNFNMKGPRRGRDKGEGTGGLVVVIRINVKIRRWYRFLYFGSRDPCKIDDYSLENLLCLLYL